MDFSEKDKLVSINDIKATFFDKLADYAFNENCTAETVMLKLLDYVESVSAIEENNNIM